MDSSEAARERAARNEALFRQVNERVKDVSDAFASIDPSPIDFVCECGSPTCAEPITLTFAEYEQVRRVPTHFVVLRAHMIAEVERVVREGNGYVVVEKLPGEREIAVGTDPRASS